MNTRMSLFSTSLSPQRQTISDDHLHVGSSTISISNSDFISGPDTGIETTAMGDSLSFGFEDAGNCAAPSSLLDELGSGFDIDPGLNHPVGGGLRVVGIDSDSDSDADPGLNSEVVDFSSGLDDTGFPVFWDPIWDDDDVVPGNRSEGFEWIVNGNENLEVSVRSSLSSISAHEEEISSLRDLEWEFLLGVNNYVNEIGESFITNAGYDAVLEVSEEYESELRIARPTAKVVVESLPLVEFREEHLRDGLVVCAVCGDEVVEGDLMNRLPCCHYYHGECIVPWLKIRNTCPVCRYELPVDDQEDENIREIRRSSDTWNDLLDGYRFEMFFSF